MKMKASLFSLNHQQRLPHDSEVARLVPLNAGPKELTDHYQIKPEPQQARPQVIQGGQQ